MPIKPFIDIKVGRSGSFYKIASMLDSVQKQFRFEDNDTIELNCSSDPDKNRMVFPVQDIPALMNLLEDCGRHYNQPVDSPEDVKVARAEGDLGQGELVVEVKDDQELPEDTGEQFDAQECLDSLDEEEIELLHNLNSGEMVNRALRKGEGETISALDKMGLVSTETGLATTPSGEQVLKLYGPITPEPGNVSDLPKTEPVEEEVAEEKVVEEPKEEKKEEKAAKEAKPEKAEASEELTPDQHAMLDSFLNSRPLGKLEKDLDEDDLLVLNEKGLVKSVGDGGYIITKAGEAMFATNGKTPEEFLQDMVDDGKVIVEGQRYEFTELDKRVRGRAKARDIAEGIQKEAKQ